MRTVTVSFEFDLDLDSYMSWFKRNQLENYECEVWGDIISYFNNQFLSL